MEETILAHLIHNDVYGRKVLPHLKSEYFKQQEHQTIFDLINVATEKYNVFPTKEALLIDLENLNGLSQQTFESAKTTIGRLEVDRSTNVQWLVDNTEKFCQDEALYNAVHEAIQIIDGKGKTPKGGIPKLLIDALQVCFDTSVGHDFVEDSDARFEGYHQKHSRIDFDIEYLNKITGGGLPKKTLSCLMASTGGGKSLAMCHFAAHNLMCNRNVLYVTLEMAEDRIAQRIDANLLDVTLDQLLLLSKVDYDKKIARLKASTKGKLIIKEFPTGSAGVGQVRHLLNELRIKKNFVPDIIYVDYLNLMISSRIKMGGSVNSYTYIKNIAEELRGLAVEFNLPIITATQANRDAIGSSDMGLENTSESMGLPATLDLFIALIATEEIQQLGQIMFKQLKNRLQDESINRRFMLGIDKAKMRLYNVDQSAQEDLIEGPVFDDSKFGSEDQERGKKKTKFNKTKFEGFK